MNGFFVLVLAVTIFGAIVWIPRALAHDRNLAALEALDDELLAAEAADAWNRGEWK
jgi:hypothetical protein